MIPLNSLMMKVIIYRDIIVAKIPRGCLGSPSDPRGFPSSSSLVEEDSITLVCGSHEDKDFWASTR